jgi:two-component system, OmpR family, response regulator QseB
MHVIVIEDNSLIRQAITQGLMGLQCSVDSFDSALPVIHSELIKYCDIILLDLGLPDIHGFEVIKSLRKLKVKTPICVLTALDDTESVVKALELGADDFVTKPFNLKELFARLKALHRRSCAQLGQAIVSPNGTIVMELSIRQVSYHGNPVELSKVEFELLQMLIEKAPKVLSKAYLEQNLASDRLDHQSNFVEVHIHHLRKKLEKNIIKTIRGIGYQLND